MAATVTTSLDQGLATLRLARAHGNAINPELAANLYTVEIPPDGVPKS